MVDESHCALAPAARHIRNYSEETDSMRIAILWSHLSGYLNACLHALADNHKTDLFVSYRTESGEAPFEASEFAWLTSHYRFTEKPNRSELLQCLQQFKPDVLLVGSWHVDEYRYILKHFKGKALRILFMDNQWLGTLKQRIGSLVAPWYIQPLYEAVFLPGERQAVFAKKLGFHDWNIIRGGYTCDHPRFAAVGMQRPKKSDGYPRAFLYVGRFTETKGITTLIKAYTRYRMISRNPFGLICCGEGNLRVELDRIEGVQIAGFLQTSELPAKFLEASCLILPSSYEPWGVVIHEATAAGMAVICSSSCGAMVHLVQPGYNGYVVEPGNIDYLASSMLRYSKLDPEERALMGENSYTLSLQYTPTRWANNLISFAQQYVG
jgi:glycosyltransferase involved in cell wall biosynthesis